MTIDELLRDHQMFHSTFQIDHFIVEKSGRTNWGKYRQALREIEKRYRGMKTLNLERQTKKLELERIERTIEDTGRELSRFVEIAKGLKKEIGDLTISKREELEAGEWIEEIKFRIEIDVRTLGMISKPTLEMMLSLPKPDQQRILAEVKPPKALSGGLD